MKPNAVKLLSVVCSVTLVLGLVSGCSNSSKKSSAASAGSTSSSKVDTSKPVELQVYMVGDGPKDLQPVVDKMNEITKKDINATAKWNYTTWTNYQQKYNLVLSSGQPIDLIYTAKWLNYGQFATQGAFMPLDSMLNNVPELYKHIPQTEWDQVKVNNKIYTVPNNYAEYTNDGMIYREDLRVKYSLPVPNTLENLEEYMVGVKKNMPSQQIVMDNIANTNGMEPFTAFDVLDLSPEFKGVDLYSMMYGMYFNFNDPSKLVDYWGSKDFIEDMKMFKRWADEGLWSKSILSDQQDANGISDGKYVVDMGGLNPNKYWGSVSAVAKDHPDWKLAYIPYSTVNGVAYPASPIGNGMAVPTTSKNPSRALMYLKEITMNKDCNLLSEYGIEGKHYTISNGIYTPGPDNANFGNEGMLGWAWRNTDYMLKTSVTDNLNSTFKQLSDISAKTKFPGVDIFGGFSENYSSYQSQRSALLNVIAQYLAPLEVGEVGDVEQGVSTFMSKAKNAGLDTVRQNYQKQWQDYCNQHNYK